MAHMIDETTGQAAIAYAGETPWHGLGQVILPEDDLATIQRKAGIAYTVERATVQYQRKPVQTDADWLKPAAGVLATYPEKHVLYRNDTGKPLSVVSKDYQIVQPSDVMGFFKELIDIGGFTMETAGALSDGRRIWALAKVHDGAPIIGNDIVKPYVLLTTSYDGTLATTGKPTAIRVVCHNTLTVAVNGAKTEIKVPHSTKFNAEAMRRDLGIFANAFDKWLIETRKLARYEIDIATAAKLTEALITPTIKAGTAGQKDVQNSRGYRRIMELFDGLAIGSNLAGFTKWGWLNAVTQYIDHERGRSDDTRMNSAWFGTGDALKSQAYELATA